MRYELKTRLVSSLQTARRFGTQHSVLSTRYAAGIWLAALAIYVLAGTPLTPFHGDESTLIYMSRDYAYLFLQANLELVRYSDNPPSLTEQHLRLLNGTVAKYLMGLSWHISGFSLDDINEQWDWGADWNYNQQNGHAPTPALLLAARWPQAALLAAGGAVMFTFGQIVGGRRTAYLASLYYAINPALLLNGRRAMMEASFTFFSLLTVLVGMWWLRKPSWKAAVALGAAGGLALASKHTAAITLAAVFGVCGGWAVWRVRQPLQTVLHFITACLLAGAVFLALNPAWWDNPVGRMRTVFNLRQELLDLQVNVFGGYATFADRLAGFLRQTLIVQPQYYEAPNWQNYIREPVTAYEASVWRGVSIGGSVPGALALAGVIGVGAWALVRRGRTEKRVRWLIGAWALVTTLATLALTPLEWQRYYLLVYPALGLLAALGVDQIIDMLVKRRHTKQVRIAASFPQSSNH